jgi:ribosomal protein L40E
MGSATGSGWYTKDSQIAPQAQQIIPIADGERFTLNGWSDGTSVASGFTADQNVTLSAVYVKQYLVTLTSTLGTAYGSGWYDAEDTARIRVTPTSIPAEGILGVLGVRSMLTGWQGDYTGSPGSDGSSVMKVDSPMTIHAVWSLNPGIILPAVVIIAVTSIVAVAFKRRKQVQFCLNCGNRLPKGSIFCLECGHRQDTDLK